MFPRYREHNEKIDLTRESFKTKRRRLNGILPQIANNFDYKVLPVNGILPDNHNIFEVNTGKLNGKGMKEFWTSVNKELKLNDIRYKEAAKNKIIQEHFNLQREQRREMQERRKGQNSRLTMPRSFNQFDRGDADFRSQKSDRSQSVPPKCRTSFRGDDRANRK